VNNQGRLCGVLLQLEILVLLERTHPDLLFSLAIDIFISCPAISAAMGSLVRFRLPAVAAFFACEVFLFLVQIIEVGAIWTTSPVAELGTTCVLRITLRNLLTTSFKADRLCVLKISCFKSSKSASKLYRSPELGCSQGKNVS
jgi:hypothetical protein